MANALIVRRNTQLAKAQKALRAAQYVRMSTDLQRYSIQNQAAAIAAYAQQRNLSIVRTYVDEGRSGLRIKGRPGLIELIEDVQSGKADFDHILVYDVSRWGRFQDVDESAHYEFVCKQKGVRVAYCAEQFDNDGSLLSSIVKNIKRVMAAEYSRELSVKVHTGQSRIASLGYRVGGPLTFGLRRELIDANARSKCGLAKGERKSLQTDRVRLQAGSDDEAAIVRWIFDQFVIGRKSDSQIARELNQAKVTNQGRSWTDGMIHTILKNENYIGNIVYNRTTRRLGQKLTPNPHRTVDPRSGGYRSDRRSGSLCACSENNGRAACRDLGRSDAAEAADDSPSKGKTELQHHQQHARPSLCLVLHQAFWIVAKSLRAARICASARLRLDRYPTFLVRRSGETRQARGRRHLERATTSVGRRGERCRNRGEWKFESHFSDGATAGQGEAQITPRSGEPTAARYSPVSWLCFD